MNTIVQNVKTFMEACFQTTESVNPIQSELYYKLIDEEYNEMLDGINNNDPVETLDGCADLVWVTVGYALSLGIISDVPEITEEMKIDDVLQTIQYYVNQIGASENPFAITSNIIGYCMKYASMRGWDFIGAYNEVYRSNMSKVDAVTGKVIKREDGKILKPASYSPPDLTSFV